MGELLGVRERRVWDDLAESADEKRSRDNSLESAYDKGSRADSADSTERKRVRDGAEESHMDSPEVKRLRDDLLGVLDDSDPDPTSQDLDSVMKSFEYELSASSTLTTVQGPGETQPDLGYLLEASDDELGLPPPPSTSSIDNEREETARELVRVSSDSSGIGENWGFEDPISSYDSFEFGIGDGYGGGYVAVDGLFEYSDVCFDSADLLSWRHESLPAE